jgi:hypothetical protein
MIEVPSESKLIIAVEAADGDENESNRLESQDELAIDMDEEENEDRMVVYFG